MAPTRPPPTGEATRHTALTFVEHFFKFIRLLIKAIFMLLYIDTGNRQAFCVSYYKANNIITGVDHIPRINSKLVPFAGTFVFLSITLPSTSVTIIESGFSLVLPVVSVK